MSSSTNIYLFKASNSNTSKLTVKTPERLSIVFIVNMGAYFLPFCKVAAVGFEEVNVC